MSFAGITGHEQSTSIEPVLSPIILNVWAQNVSDPFTSIDAVEVLEVSFHVNVDISGKY